MDGLGKWPRIDVRVELARRGRRGVQGTVRIGAAVIAQVSARRADLDGAIARLATVVEPAIASALAVAPAALVRIVIAIRGSRRWRRTIAGRRWPRLVARWCPSALLVIERPPARRRPALHLPLAITLPARASSRALLGPIVDEAQGRGWTAEPRGAIVHARGDDRLLALRTPRTRLVIAPATLDCDEAELDAGAVSLVRIDAPAALAATISHQLYCAILDDAPIDVALASAMRAAGAGTETVRLDLLRGGEDDVRPSRAVLEQAVAPLPRRPSGHAKARPEAAALRFVLERARRVRPRGTPELRGWPAGGIDLARLDATRAQFARAVDERRLFADVAERLAGAARGPDYTRHASLWWAGLDGAAAAPEEPLVVGREQQLSFAVLEDVRAGASTAPLTDRALRTLFADRATIDVEVVFFAPATELRIAQPRIAMELPRFGDSRVVSTLATPLVAGLRSVRAGLYHRGHLLQSVVLRARALAADAPVPRDLQAPPGAVEDWVMTADGDALAAARGPARSLVFNDDADGNHWIAVYGRDGRPVAGVDGPWTIALPALEVDDAARTARNALGRIAGSRGDDGKLAAAPVYRFAGPAITDDLVADRAKAIVDLARAGRTLYAGLIEDHLPARPDRTADQVLDELAATLAPADRLMQIARVDGTGSTVPWALAYDLPIDPGDDTLALCDVIRADLVARGDRIDDPVGCHARPDCPLRDPARAPHTVCPFGFWGFRHELELPSFDVAPDRPPAPRVVRVSPSERMVGVSAFRFTEIASHVQALTKETTVVGPAFDRDDVLALLRSGEHALLYFFCHGDQTPNGFALRVGGPKGGDHILASSLMVGAAATAQGWHPDRWSARAPLVFLNGCDTVAFDARVLSRFIGRFRRLGASGVIGTEIEVFTTLAVEVGRDLVRRLAAGVHLGDALLAMRRQLLRDLNPLGLAYTGYAPAMVHIHNPTCSCTTEA